MNRFFISAGLLTLCAFFLSSCITDEPKVSYHTTLTVDVSPFCGIGLLAVSAQKDADPYLTNFNTVSCDCSNACNVDIGVIQAAPPFAITVTVTSQQQSGYIDVGFYHGSLDANGSFIRDSLMVDRQAMAKAYHSVQGCFLDSAGGLSYYSWLGGCVQDARTGYYYPTTEMHKLRWMMRNLDYPMEDGRLSFCYNDDPFLCGKYGRLYTWYGMMDGDSGNAKPVGICPDGWRLPTDADWQDFELFFAISDTGATGERITALSSTYQWQVFVNQFAGFREAWPLPRDTVLGYGRIDQDASYWSASSSPSGPYQAWKRKFAPAGASIRRDEAWKTNAFSVRCVQDL